MKNSLFLILQLLFFSTCNNLSPREKDLHNILNKQIKLGMLQSIHPANTTLSFQELRQMHDYLSIIYLQNGCKPCYPKFLEWYQKMDSLFVDDNYTLLFVIEGHDYDEFMKNVLSLDYVDDKFYTIMDPYGKFLEQNREIPRWIIDASVLIDSENKIKMVGAPWLNEDMTKLFYKTIGSEQ